MYHQNEKVQPINVAEEMSKSVLDYSMSVISSRALPDARDGLNFFVLVIHRQLVGTKIGSGKFTAVSSYQLSKLKWQ